MSDVKKTKKVLGTRGRATTMKPGEAAVARPPVADVDALADEAFAQLESSPEPEGMTNDDVEK